MYNADISDPEFRKAIDAIDAGDHLALLQILEENPALVGKRLDQPDKGYFARPYLLWFVAENPIRHEKLPSNVAEITQLIIRFVRLHAADSLQSQLDYTLALVATGRVARESGMQIKLIDLLVDEGAQPGNGHGALAHGNADAARRLIERGGEMTLTTAIGLDKKEDIERFLNFATAEEKQIGLIAAAYLKKPGVIRLLIESGVNLNSLIEASSGFHSHASALHQAVYSGLLQSVKLLVENGASLNVEDTVYHGTPLDWARYMKQNEKNKKQKKNFEEIERYLEGL
ncbi:MAG: ankyrin repeat domain-containing protein [Flavisolibacter sp.]